MLKEAVEDEVDYSIETEEPYLEAGLRITFLISVSRDRLSLGSDRGLVKMSPPDAGATSRKIITLTSRFGATYNPCLTWDRGTVDPLREPSTRPGNDWMHSLS